MISNKEKQLLHIFIKIKYYDIHLRSIFFCLSENEFKYICKLYIKNIYTDLLYKCCCHESKIFEENKKHIRLIYNMNLRIGNKHYYYDSTFYNFIVLLNDEYKKKNTFDYIKLILIESYKYDLYSQKYQTIHVIDFYDLFDYNKIEEYLITIQNNPV